MKKLLLLVVILTMAGIANAQHYKTLVPQCSPSGEVDCQNDPYNCGSIGHVCNEDYQACQAGQCNWCDDSGPGGAEGSYCGPDVPPPNCLNQPPNPCFVSQPIKRKPFRLKPLPLGL